jgi:hypothetical protein
MVSGLADKRKAGALVTAVGRPVEAVHAYHRARLVQSRDPAALRDARLQLLERRSRRYRDPRVWQRAGRQPWAADLGSDLNSAGRRVQFCGCGFPESLTGWVSRPVLDLRSLLLTVAANGFSSHCWWGWYRLITSGRAVGE